MSIEALHAQAEQIRQRMLAFARDRWTPGDKATDTELSRARTECPAATPFTRAALLPVEAELPPTTDQEPPEGALPQPEEVVRSKPSWARAVAAEAGAGGTARRAAAARAPASRVGTSRRTRAVRTGTVELEATRVMA